MVRKRLLDETDQLVARNIRYQRMQRGLSQDAVAQELGLTFQQLQKYEKGVNRISIGRLVRIAKILDVPVSTLLDGVEDSGQHEASPTLRERLSDRLSVRLIEAFSSISRLETRRAFVTLLEQVTSAGGEFPAQRSLMAEEQRAAPPCKQGPHPVE
jgi:transcriptional regulator with XRE-family HTH domain